MAQWCSGTIHPADAAIQGPTDPGVSNQGCRSAFIKNLAFYVFTRATRSIARYMLRQRGWVAGWMSHAGILYQNG